MKGNDTMKNILVVMLLRMGVAFAGIDFAPIDVAADRYPRPLKVDMTCIGSLHPHAVSAIRAFSWTLGCETIELPVYDSPCLLAELDALRVDEVQKLKGGK